MKELLIAVNQTAAELRPAPQIEGWATVTSTWDEFERRQTLPEVTLVEVGLETDKSKLESLVGSIEKIAPLRKTPTAPHTLLFHFQTDRLAHRFAISDDEIHRGFGSVQRMIHSLVRQLDVDVRVSYEGLDGFQIELYLQERSLKCALVGSGELGSPRPSNLDQVEAIRSATAGFRAESGRLSLSLVADAFGVSDSSLAGWLGKNRQTVSKTPDAESLQPSLEFFERVGRLLVVLSEEDFRKWLRSPNPLLGERQPLDLLREGKWQVAADLVDDMLTGSPT